MKTDPIFEDIFCDDWKKLEKFETDDLYKKKCIKARITTKAPRLVTRPDNCSETDNRAPGY